MDCFDDASKKTQRKTKQIELPTFSLISWIHRFFANPFTRKAISLDPNDIYNNSVYKSPAFRKYNQFNSLQSFVVDSKEYQVGQVVQLKSKELCCIVNLYYSKQLPKPALQIEVKKVIKFLSNDCYELQKESFETSPSEIEKGDTMFCNEILLEKKGLDLTKGRLSCYKCHLDPRKLLFW